MVYEDAITDVLEQVLDAWPDLPEPGLSRAIERAAWLRSGSDSAPLWGAG